ncbi:MAG TPA: cell division protein ZapE [Cellvibrionaceae bacterium]|nr:cell division protein ZapE [Cellvibrionaceae bacterium]
MSNSSTPALLTPLARYQQDSLQPGFIADASQAAAVAALDELFASLIAAQAAQPSLWQALWARRKPNKEPLVGLYFWGGVGRGKTYLMDLFFDALPFERKMRTHFHRFMRRVHAELTQLKGQKNPLEQVADRLTKETCVICFDEFFVTDITDAMLLSGLLSALFKRGVCLVATSNIVPDGLYPNGLQREKFLPAIALLNRYTRVINVDGGVDYRLRTLQQAALYFYPLTVQAQSELVRHFERLSHGAPQNPVTLTIEGRPVVARSEWEDIVWFEFKAICEGPRSQQDYIVLAKEYHTVLLSEVPILGAVNDDAARRFVYLVDEFYDRGVKLIISAAEPIVSLYTTGKLSFEFARTQSRLLEMQSEAYLASPHKP